MGLITLNRPKAMNALNDDLSQEVIGALKAFDDDASIGAIVLTGFEKAFAAGADIREMHEKSFVDMFNENYFSAWDSTYPARCRLAGNRFRDGSPG